MAPRPGRGRLDLELAEQLNQRAPDDVVVYGFLVDANVELGNYDAAVDAAQWMLDLHPGNVPALTRAAYLRELHTRGATVLICTHDTAVSRGADLALEIRNGQLAP